MLRRWRVVVIDDNPEGSLEGVLLWPLVVSRRLPFDSTRQDLAAAVETNLLNAYLPLESGEAYATYADVEFQLLDFDERRAACRPRYPIVEVQRDFARAWQLVDEWAKDPPDIIFLDVMFDPKTTPMADVEAVIDDLETSDRIGQAGRPGIGEILGRGGLFLFGKLLRSMREVQNMPMVVLYSASREVQIDFLPFEYASDGRFEVVEKRVLRSNAERRKQVFRRRIRDFFSDGTVRPDQVRAAVELLADRDAIAGDQETLRRALSYPVGSHWCFGTLFPAECVAYVSSEPARRHLVVEELETFIAPLVGDARSFVDLIASSPARLFSHNGPVMYAKHPSWLEERLAEPVSGSNHVRVSGGALNGELSDPQRALELEGPRMPANLREVLATALNANRIEGEATVATLDRFVSSLEGHDSQWTDLLSNCRMRMPAAEVAMFLSDVTPKDIDLKVDTDVLTGAWDRANNLELFLSPSGGLVKEPLASLLKAVIEGMRSHAYKCNDGGKVHIRYAAGGSPSSLEIEVRDDGPGFPGLRYYDPHGRGGDLSTALVAASQWFEVEIHSGGVKRRPAARGAGKVESSAITAGTQFVIRIPAYRLEV